MYVCCNSIIHQLFNCHQHVIAYALPFCTVAVQCVFLNRAFRFELQRFQEIRPLQRIVF